jgi:hypothetical protein
MIISVPIGVLLKECFYEEVSLQMDTMFQVKKEIVVLVYSVDSTVSSFVLLLSTT